MEETKEGEAAVREVVVSVSSREDLVSTDTTPLSDLETKKKSRLYNYLYGPYRQHQHLIDCVLQLKKENQCQGEDVPGRMLHLGSPCLSQSGRNCLGQFWWYLALLLPFVFIVLGEVCRGTLMLCCCSVGLCLLISCHSILIFFILHNQKIAKRFWFVNKVDLDHHCGRENQIVEVTVDNAMSQPFLSAGVKSRVIARLARSKDQKGVMMMCTRSFWVSCVQDPLICLLIPLTFSLIALIVSIDWLRRLHF